MREMRSCFQHVLCTVIYSSRMLGQACFLQTLTEVFYPRLENYVGDPIGFSISIA